MRFYKIPLVEGVKVKIENLGKKGVFAILELYNFHMVHSYYLYYITDSSICVLAFFGHSIVGTGITITKLHTLKVRDLQLNFFCGVTRFKIL